MGAQTYQGVAHPSPPGRKPCRPWWTTAWKLAPSRAPLRPSQGRSGLQDRMAATTSAMTSASRVVRHRAARLSGRGRCSERAARRGPESKNGPRSRIVPAGANAGHRRRERARKVGFEDGHRAPRVEAGSSRGRTRAQPASRTRHATAQHSLEAAVGEEHEPAPSSPSLGATWQSGWPGSASPPSERSSKMRVRRSSISGPRVGPAGQSATETCVQSPLVSLSTDETLNEDWIQRTWPG